MGRRAGAHRRRLRPGDRRGRGARSRSRARRRSTPRCRAPARPSAEWREVSLARRVADPVRVPRAARAAQGRARRGSISAEHGKVRVRRARRGRPRPGGRRVRVRDPAPAEGRLLGVGVDRHRRALDPPAARRRRRHHAVQLPGDGPDVDVPGRDRVRQRVRAQAERARSVGVAADRRALGRGRAARRACSPWCTATRRRSTALLTHPGRAGGELRRLDARSRGHVYETAAANGKRVQALGGAKNHMVVLPDADLEPAADAAVSAGLRIGRRAVHGDLGRRRGRRVGDELVDADRDAHARGAGRRGRRARRGDGPARHRRRTATGCAATSTAGSPRARARRRRARRGACPTPGFFLGPCLFDHVTPEMAIYRDEIFGPVLSRRAGRRPTTRRCG